MLPRLRRFAYGLTGSVDSGDDLVQSACERALTRLHQWEPGTRLDSWMFRIMKNLWLDDTRAGWRREVVTSTAILEVPIGTVMSRLARARLTLGQALEPSEPGSGERP